MGKPAHFYTRFDGRIGALNERQNSRGSPRLPQLVLPQRQMMHVPKGRFVVGNRTAESGKRGGQDLDAIEIGAHGVERALQIALYSIYGRIRFQGRFLRRFPSRFSCQCVRVCRVKAWRGGWFRLADIKIARLMELRRYRFHRTSADHKYLRAADDIAESSRIG